MISPVTVIQRWPSLDHWRGKQFVQNRVTEIRELVPVTTAWRHCPGELNPADIPSRRTSPHELQENLRTTVVSWTTRATTSQTHCGDGGGIASTRRLFAGDEGEG